MIGSILTIAIVGYYINRCVAYGSKFSTVGLVMVRFQSTG
jgi:hypothetical protein